jgi:hypothetical protein
MAGRSPGIMRASGQKGGAVMIAAKAMRVHLLKRVPVDLIHGLSVVIARLDRAIQ